VLVRAGGYALNKKNAGWGVGGDVSCFYSFLLSYFTLSYSTLNSSTLKLLYSQLLYSNLFCS